MPAEIWHTRLARPVIAVRHKLASEVPKGRNRLLRLMAGAEDSDPSGPRSGGGGTVISVNHRLKLAAQRRKLRRIGVAEEQAVLGMVA